MLLVVGRYDCQPLHHSLTICFWMLIFPRIFLWLAMPVLIYNSLVWQIPTNLLKDCKALQNISLHGNPISMDQFQQVCHIFLMFVLILSFFFSQQYFLCRFEHLPWDKNLDGRIPRVWSKEEEEVRQTNWLKCDDQFQRPWWGCRSLRVWHWHSWNSKFWTKVSMKF